MCTCSCVLLPSECVTHNLIHGDRSMFTPSAPYHHEPPPKLSHMSFPFTSLATAFALFFHLSSLNQHLFSFIHSVNLHPPPAESWKINTDTISPPVPLCARVRVSLTFYFICLIHQRTQPGSFHSLTHKPSVYAKCIQGSGWDVGFSRSMWLWLCRYKPRV